jgi:hypothetical protein
VNTNESMFCKTRGVCILYFFLKSTDDFYRNHSMGGKKTFSFFFPKGENGINMNMNLSIGGGLLFFSKMCE